MAREILMLPFRLVVQIFEVSLVMFFSAVSKITNTISSAISTWITRGRNTVLAVAMVVVVFLVLLWISIFIYWSFYYSYVPAVSHTKDVNLIFSSQCSGRGPCSFPTANLSLVSSGQQSLLMRGQQYQVSLDLDMPESPVNRDLGMFMVRLDLYSKHGEVVRTAQRAAMLGYKSTIFRITETIFYLPLLLYSYTQEKQNINVLLFSTFVEDPYKPVQGAYIEVQTTFIEIYKAMIKIEAQFTGLRYILFAWPLTSAFFGISIIFVFLSLIALLSWYNLFWSASSGESTNSHFTGNVPRDLSQPESLGSHRPKPSNDFEEFENVIREEKSDELGETHSLEEEPRDLDDANDLTLRKRLVTP